MALPEFLSGFPKRYYEAAVCRYLRLIEYLGAWRHRLTSWVVRNVAYDLRITGKLGGICKGSPVLLTSDPSSAEFTQSFGIESIQEILNEANQIICHRFRIFPKIEVNAGQDVNWHRDYLSETDYPPSYYRRLELRNPSRPDDPKVPWELSRFHHGLRMAQAYALSGDEKYAEGFLRLFVDWCERNPWKFGVNWTCAMEVAIRACNWIAAFELVRNSKSVRPVHLRRFRNSLEEHLSFIFDNLEWSEEATTNHYIADLLGLVIITASHPELPGASEAQEFGFQQLEKEADKQFYVDGGNWESSTTYQRFVTEMLLIAALIAKRNHRSLSDEFHQRVKDSIHLLTSLANSAGQIPQLGDNDSGRILPFKQRKDGDIRHLGVLAALLYEDINLVSIHWGFPEEAYWIFGKEGYDRYKGLKASARDDNCYSAAFPEAGWYAMRASDAVMVISAVPNGQNGKGGHCHNDRLSFTLSLGDQEVIVDRGTFTYSSDTLLRREFRSTASHNTVMVDEREQNRFMVEALFWVFADTEVQVKRWSSEPYFDMFVGEHTGYLRLDGEVTHRRAIYFDKARMTWLVVDDVFEKHPTTMERSIVLPFHFATDRTVGLPGEPDPERISEILSRLVTIEIPPMDNELGVGVPTQRGDVFLLPTSSSPLTKSIEDFWISDSYRSRYPGTSIRYQVSDRLPVRILTYLWFD